MPGTGEILASIDDINAELDGEVVAADNINVALIQISVARIVRGYLSRIIDNVTLATWTTPSATPDLIRTVAGKLIASQLYVNSISRTSTEVDPNNFAQKKYDEAMNILNQIIAGDITIPLIDSTPVEGLTTLDFFPLDDKDRAFTLGMNL